MYNIITIGIYYEVTSFIQEKTYTQPNIFMDTENPLEYYIHYTYTNHLRRRHQYHYPQKRVLFP